MLREQRLSTCEIGPRVRPSHNRFSQRLSAETVLNSIHFEVCSGAALRCLSLDLGPSIRLHEWYRSVDEHPFFDRFHDPRLRDWKRLARRGTADEDQNWRSEATGFASLMVGKREDNW